MAKIVAYREIPLDDLVIDKAQVRTSNTGAEIDELAQSIKKMGLLQPIVVCKAKADGKWEVLAGQRRALAYKLLERDRIMAAEMDERVDEGEAKAISITENVLRRKLSGPELVGGIRFLYKHYGSITAVVAATGLPRQTVKANLFYDRLSPELQKLVDEEGVDIKVAVSAHDAASTGADAPDPDVAVTLAKEMTAMSGVQRKKLTDAVKRNPNASISEVVEEARSAKETEQVIATVTRTVHNAIKRFAREEDAGTQDEAVAQLIEESLIDRGYLENA